MCPGGVEEGELAVMFGICLLNWLSRMYVYSATLSSRFWWGFNSLCFGTMQLLEEVLCKTTLPQSNLHASSPSKPTTTSFISTNLTIHTNPVQPIRHTGVAKPSELHYLQSIISPSANHTPYVLKEQIHRTGLHYTLYMHDYLPHWCPFAHEHQRNSLLRVTFWYTSSPCRYGKTTFHSSSCLIKKLSGYKQGKGRHLQNVRHPPIQHTIPSHMWCSLPPSHHIPSLHQCRQGCWVPPLLCQCLCLLHRQQWVGWETCGVSSP